MTKVERFMLFGLGYTKMGPFFFLVGWLVVTELFGWVREAKYFRVRSEVLSGFYSTFVILLVHV